METLKTLRQGAPHYSNWDKIIFKSGARSSPWFLPESNCKKTPLLLIGFAQVLKLHDDYILPFYTTADDDDCDNDDGNDDDDVVGAPCKSQIGRSWTHPSSPSPICPGTHLVTPQLHTWDNAQHSAVTHTGQCTVAQSHTAKLHT